MTSSRARCARMIQPPLISRAGRPRSDFPVAQTRQHLLGLGFGLRVAQGFVLGVGFEVLRTADAAGFLEFAQLFFQRRQLAGAARGDIHHGFLADGFALLRQVADHRPLVALDGAGVGLVRRRISEKSVDLPAPFGPTRATRSP